MRNVVKILLIPILLSFILIIWFYIIQNAGDIPIKQIQIFNNELEYALYKTISHSGEKHLLSNVTSFIVLSILLLSIQNTKYYFIELIILFFLCVLILVYYSIGVGFSAVVLSLNGITLILMIYFAFNKNIYDTYGRTIIINYILLLYLSKQLIIDILFYTSIFQKSNLVKFFIFSKIPNGYTQLSAEIHLIGFIIGVVIGLIFIICSHIYNINVYRI